MACSAGNSDVVASLLEKGVDIHARYGADLTPLHDAAKSGHKDVVRMLLEHRAEVNAPDIHGKTALIFAAQQGHKDVAELLVSYGGLQCDAGKKALNYMPKLRLK